MNQEALLIVLGMALVTYIPRMLPLVVLQHLKLPAFLRRQMELIPYAVLGALIFPGVLYSTASIWSAVAGATVAVLLSLLRANLLLIVLGSIAAVYAVEAIYL
ncbi:MAG TPA: AzlD domain-containing protein [Bacilli bacterium]